MVAEFKKGDFKQGLIDGITGRRIVEIFSLARRRHK
jgi:hypothetical protein